MSKSLLDKLSKTLGTSTSGFISTGGIISSVLSALNANPLNVIFEESVFCSSNVVKLGSGTEIFLFSFFASFSSNSNSVLIVVLLFIKFVV